MSIIIDMRMHAAVYSTMCMCVFSAICNCNSLPSIPNASTDSNQQHLPVPSFNPSYIRLLQSYFHVSKIRNLSCDAKVLLYL